MKNRSVTGVGIGVGIMSLLGLLIIAVRIVFAVILILTLYNVYQDPTSVGRVSGAIVSEFNKAVSK